MDVALLQYTCTFKGCMLDTCCQNDRKWYALFFYKGGVHFLFRTTEGRSHFIWTKTGGHVIF